MPNHVTTESPLPLRDTASDVETEATAKVDPRSLSYLIVDDQRFDRNMLKQALRIHHINEFLEAEDAAEAFKIIRAPGSRVDFILVDQELPILSGFDFTRLVRRGVDIPNPGVPIIMFSGVTAEWVVTEARAAGVDDFIAKPFSPDGLFNRIQRTLNHPRPLANAVKRAGKFAGPAPRKRR